MTLKPCTKSRLARFSILLLNPTVAPFDSKECRQIFAAAFRENLISMGLPRSQLEGSLTPKIFPGYLNLEELTMKAKVHTLAQLESCKVHILKSQPKWAAHSAARRELPEKALEKTLSDFGVKLTAPAVFDDRSKQNAHFARGESLLMFGSSGLWPQDPYGDLQMLFTPNLHMTLKFAAADLKMQELIESLRSPLEPMEKRKIAAELNRHIYEEALCIPFSHSRRFFLTTKERSLKGIPAAITAATPWQVFE